MNCLFPLKLNVMIWNVKDQDPFQDPFVYLTLSSVLRWDVHRWTLNQFYMWTIPDQEKSSQISDILKEAILGRCLKLPRATSEKKHCLFTFNWKWQCDICHVVSGGAEVNEVIWLLHYVTYLRTYLLHLQQPSLFVLPHNSAVAATWVNLWQMHLCVIFLFAS